ncbi:MAG: arginine deiminase [Acidimicrobiia bacterium]|nr:arginine deiminase [Acidimicrobiia bacterium]
MGSEIRSEVGRLRAVIVHRPDLELHRLTPGNKDELLFDELVWVEKAREEHDAFSATIADSGAQVLHLSTLLEEVLTDRELAFEFVEAHVTEDLCGRRLAERVRRFLLELTVPDLVRHLIGGVTLEEVGETEGLVAALHGPDDFILTPLPNAVFMRDSSVWVGSGAILNPMNRPVRQRETNLLRLVYGLHPLFAGSPIWFGDQPGEHYPASVEGGDVLVVGDRGLAIGISERTTPSGAAALAAQLFEQNVIDRILAVELPKARSTMHLDTVVTMVDVDAFVLYTKIRHQVRVLQVTSGAKGHLKVDEVEDLVAGLAWATGLGEVRTIEPPIHSIQAEREQWNDANNTFALAPGEVVAYERNVATNEVLEDAGITVHRIPSYELPRGRGGPRCMTCPVRRDPLPS